MDSAKSGLRVFEIPETLDWRSLLRPPGQDYVNVLDASEADDPEAWNESDISNALEVLKESTIKNVGDCLNALKPEVFNAVFNLNRIYSNLEKQNQILLCQFLSTLCSKVQVILESIPPKPYTNDSEASKNITYTEFTNKITLFTANLAEFDEASVSPQSEKYKDLTVLPRTVGLVARSLTSVSVFVLCMCHKFATTFEKNEVKTFMELNKGKRGRKSKKEDTGTKINTMALEKIIDGLLTCCRYNLKYQYASEYGGNNKPSIPMLRMLFQTLLQTISLDEKIYSVSNNMVQSIAKIIKVNFTTMHLGKLTHENYEAKVKAEMENSEQESPEAHEASANNDQQQERPENVEEENDDNINSEYDDEWMYMLVDEMKKPKCTVIVDVLEILKDSNIPNIIVNELFVNIKENYSSQISNTNQLISSMVQNEFTNIGLFFEKMAKKVPCVVLSNINQLKQLFDVPCYFLRKSIMESIKTLIIMSKYYDTSGGGEGGNLENEEVEAENIESFPFGNKEDNYKLKVSKLCCRNREMLLDIILGRQFDCYMYARACVLKILYELVESDALPVRKYNLVVAFATERLMDKGSQVRQKALSLVSLIVEVVTNKKFLLALDTDKLNYELKIVTNNIKKVNFMLSQQSLRKYSLDPSVNLSRRNSLNSTKRSELRKGSVEFVDAQEYDYDIVLLQLKCDFGNDVLNKLEELYSKLELAKELYTDAVEISERVDVCLELCKKLLRSPTETDQRASIKFICTCHLLGLEKATKMLSLVWALSWSNNQNVVEAVIMEFKNVYFQSVSESKGLHKCCNLLIELIKTGDLTYLSSVEKIFQISQSKQELLEINLNQLINPLIKIATTSSLESGETKKRSEEEEVNNDLLRCKKALNLIKIIMYSNQNSIGARENTKELEKDAKGKLKEDNKGSDGEEYEWDLNILKNILTKYKEEILLEVCQILIYVKNEENLQELVTHILKQFLDYFGTLKFNWFQIAQIVIDLTFTHLPDPMNLWSNLIKELLSDLISEPKKEDKGGENKSEVRKLSHIIFIAGHVSIKSMIYVEKVQNELKAARANLNEEQLDNNMGMATKDEKDREFFDHVVENKLVNDNLLGGPMYKIIVEALINPEQFIHTNEKRHKSNYISNVNQKNNNTNNNSSNNNNNSNNSNNNSSNNTNNNKNNNSDTNNSNTNNINNGSNNKNNDDICVNNNVNGVNGCYDVEDEEGPKNCPECNILFICSVISLCKFATISKRFCNMKILNNQSVIQVIISLLLYTSDNSPSGESTEGNEEEDIMNILKCNLLICYGDLLVRHPNIMEPMNDSVFKLLSYPVNSVRETAILVFSHLVMNDMIKPKGKLLDNVMFLTQDRNEKIANYARVFINEINRKNQNTIYNCFPEMLSTLSRPSKEYFSITSNQEEEEKEGEIQENDELKGIKINLKILNEVFNYIKNDKQEHLVEKVCMRLNKAKSIFATTVYVNTLLLINYDEKNLIKLSKSLNMLRQLLSESQPLLAALCIIHKRIKSSKVQKVQGQVDIKEVADEMINKIKNILGQGKATMLMRASQFGEQIIDLLNKGNYTATNLRSLFEKEKDVKYGTIKVKREEGDSSSNSGEYSSSTEGDDYLLSSKEDLANSQDQSNAATQQDLIPENSSAEDLTKMDVDESEKKSGGSRRNSQAKGGKGAEVSKKGKRGRNKRSKVVSESEEEEEFEDEEEEGEEEEQIVMIRHPSRGNRGRNKIIDSEDEEEEESEGFSEDEEIDDYEAEESKPKRGRRSGAKK